MNEHDLERFVEPVRTDLDRILHELGDGRKVTHWMWYAFPQLRVLGRSDIAKRYGLDGTDEAERFLAHPYLGPTYERLVGAAHDVVVVHGHRVHDVFGTPDDLKLVSSLTLFRAVAERTGRRELAERCAAILEAADREGLPPCGTTAATITGTDERTT